MSRWEALFGFAWVFASTVVLSTILYAHGLTWTSVGTALLGGYAIFVSLKYYSLMEERHDIAPATSELWPVVNREFCFSHNSKTGETKLLRHGKEVKPKKDGYYRIKCSRDGSEFSLPKKKPAAKKQRKQRRKCHS